MPDRESVFRLVEELRQDQRRRWLQGDRVLVESYLEQHAELLSAEEGLLDLVYSEFCLREELGESVQPQEYLGRFPHLADQLQPLFEIHQAMSSAGIQGLETSQTPLLGSQNCLPSVPAPKEMLGYEIHQEIGRGGMGIVYKAFDPRRQQVVALKTLQWMDASSLYRFKQEFRALADVTHPNLVNLYELISDGRQWFFTMEFVEGVDFRSFVCGSEPPREGFSTGQLQRLRGALRQLALGIAALHNVGKLHRDVKHSNVLVTPEGRVVLLDFGLSAELRESGLHHSTQQHVLGTVSYMSPEQAAGSPVSTATDWYSVGVMLYEVLTGRLPFSGPPLSIAQQKQRSEPPSPTNWVSDLPLDLAELCVALLRQSPAARAGAGEILSYLGEEPESFTSTGYNAPVPAPLVGRESQLSALHAAADDVLAGRTVLVRVTGRSGAGKSSLVQRFLEEATARQNMAILSGRCYEQESVPFKALDGIIDALSRYLNRLGHAEVDRILPRDVTPLVRLFPVLSRVLAVAQPPRLAVEIDDQQELRQRAFDALRELLARLGDRRAVVLFLDDLQWGDFDSAQLLPSLLRPPRPPRLLWLAAYRSEDQSTSPFLRTFLQLQREIGAEVDQRDVDVTPLSTLEAAQLAKLLMAESRQSEEIVARISLESGGNPYFVQELAEHVDLRNQASSGELNLDTILWNRAQTLEPAARALLEIIAVAGHPLAVHDAHAAAKIAAPHLLQILCRARLVRMVAGNSASACDTYHDRVRETILARLPPSRVQACHHQLAIALESSAHADAEVLARHFQEAKEPIRAGEYYIRAADEAASALAFDNAARFCRLALDLIEPTGTLRQTLLRKLGDALANVGRGADAASAYLEAAENATTSDELDLRRKATEQLLTSGRIDQGLSALRGVLRIVGVKYPRSPLSALLRSATLWAYLRCRGFKHRARTPDHIDPALLAKIDVCWSAMKGLCLVDAVRGVYFQLNSLSLALKSGDQRRIVRALAQHAGHESQFGSQSEQRTARLFAAAEHLASSLQDPYSVALVVFMKGGAAYLQGHWVAARNHCDESERLFREHCSGTTWELAMANTFALWSRMFTGELQHLGTRRRKLLEVARSKGDLFAITNLGTYMMAYDRLAKDETEIAQRELDHVMAQWSQQGFHVQHNNWLHAQSMISLYGDSGDVAWKSVDRHWPQYRQSLLLKVQQIRIDTQRLRAMAALVAAKHCADKRPMIAIAKSISRQLERERATWATALATLIRACATACESGPEAAIDLTRNALDSLDRDDMHLWAAAARRRLGNAIGGEEGRALIEQSDAWMAGQGIVNPVRMTAMLAPGFPD